MTDGAALFWFMTLVLPATVGIIVAVAKPLQFVNWINASSHRWEESHRAADAKGGVIAGTWLVLSWSGHKLHQWTASIGDDAVRAGARFGLFFCIVSVSLILIASLIYLVVVIAMVGAVLWVAGRVLEDEAAARRRRQRRADALLEECEGSPLAAREGRSRREKDFWGNEYTEHRNAEGDRVARSTVQKDWLGNRYVETRNENGDVIETSRAREKGWFGDPYVEHQNREGEKTGESRDRKGWFGSEYVEHRDSEGEEISRSQDRADWLGNPYTEHKPKD